MVTIAILGIMATVLITAFSNAAGDSAKVIARQQQTAVQAALNAWISGDSNRVTIISAPAGTAKPKTIEEIRSVYNGAVSSRARLALISGYLDETTFLHLDGSTFNAEMIKSDALDASKQYLSLPTWASGSYPQVLLQAQ